MRDDRFLKTATEGHHRWSREGEKRYMGEGHIREAPNVLL